LQLAETLEQQGHTSPEFRALIVSLRCKHDSSTINPGHGRDPTPWIHCSNCLLYQLGTSW
jgi:hypothetical protein